MNKLSKTIDELCNKRNLTCNYNSSEISFYTKSEILGFDTLNELVESLLDYKFLAIISKKGKLEVLFVKK